MKKYRRFFTAGLPWLIILLAMTQVTNAALITPDANGDVVNSSGASYTVNLGAGSSIDGGLFRDGISATFQSATTAAVLIIDLDASNGAGAIYGINPDLGVTLTNSGLIEGNNIVFADGTYDDTLNLNHGSRLIGSVNGGTGTNIINFGEGLSTPGGTGNSISGNVLGFHSINKDLGGVAFIGLPVDLKNSVLTDAININSGGLYINGFINGVNGVSPSLITTNGAALGGTGLWYAAVNVNAGGISVGSTPINLAVTPTDSVGALTITGNVTHTPGSFIGFDMIPQNGGNDLITTVGTYAVNGTNVHIATTDNNRAISNGTYTIVDSTGGILNFPSVGVITSQLNPNVNAADTGYIGSEIVTGGSVTNNSSTVLSQYFSTLSLSDDGTDLLLNITHNFTSLATTPNGVAFATALDASINSPNPQIQDLIGALDNSNLAYVQAALNGLSPDATFATTKALVSENYRMDSLVQDHLALTRNGGSTIMESPATKDSKGGSNPAQYSSSGMSRGNVWGNVSYSWQDIDNNFDGEEASFSAGVDYRISRNFLIGLLLDGSNADNNYTGGSSEVDSLRAAIYGTYGQSTGIYVDFLAGYGAHDFRLSDTGGILGGSNSDTDAESLQAMLTFGYAMQAGNVKHGPFVGLEYQNVNVNSYTQSGLIPIAVDGYNVDSLRLLAGYRVEASYGRFAPYASVAYAHEFRDDAISTSATLPGGATFGVNGSGLGSSILISVGANYALTDNLTLTGGYLGAICVESDGVDSHGASLGLNWAF